jgi:hypothetical protein
MLTAADLAALDRDELLAVLRSGHAIDPRELDDTEYRGVSLGLPGIVVALTWKKFKKVFHRDAETGALRGWNVRIEQSDDDLWRPRHRRGRIWTFGHYEVVPARGRGVPRGCDRGLLIDYGLGGNRPLDPMRRVRDPIVAVHPGDNQLLLGWSYLDLGLARLGTPSFFSLERDGALTHRVDPPRPRRSA